MFGRSEVVRHDPAPGGVTHAAIRRQESPPWVKKTLLGLLAISPLVFLVFVIAASISSDLVAALPGWLQIVLLHESAILLALTWGSAITFAAIVLKSQNRHVVEKVGWVIFLFVWPKLASIICWFLVVVREKVLLNPDSLPELTNRADQQREPGPTDHTTPPAGDI